jgi:hypothetical protein
VSDSCKSEGFQCEPPPDDPALWLGSTELLDLEDPRLRLRALALTQLCQTQREKALAVFGFVKRIPFAKPLKLRLKTAREVIDASRADAVDKATALVALLRIAGIPARLHYIELRGEILRGLTSTIATAGRPVAEIWLDERWMRTDTFIFDAAYMAAARQRLKDNGWDWGYGIHRDGHMVWSGYGDAFLGGAPIETNPMVIRGLGIYHDPRGLVSSKAWRDTHPRMARAFHWSLLAPLMGRVVRELRRDTGVAAAAAGPRRIS